MQLAIAEEHADVVEALSKVKGFDIRMSSDAHGRLPRKRGSSTWSSSSSTRRTCTPTLPTREVSRHFTWLLAKTTSTSLRSWQQHATSTSTLSPRNTAIYVAPHEGNYEVPKALTSFPSIELCIVNCMGSTALHVAAYEGHLDIIDLFSGAASEAAASTADTVMSIVPTRRASPRCIWPPRGATWTW